MDISRITGMGAPRPADAVPSGRVPAPRPESAPDPVRSGEGTRQVETLRKPQTEPEVKKQDQREQEVPRVEETRKQNLSQVTARIRYEETLNRPIIQFLDENRQVIRQYPPEALVQFSLRFRELQQRLFDQRG